MVGKLREYTKSIAQCLPGTLTSKAVEASCPYSILAFVAIPRDGASRREDGVMPELAVVADLFKTPFVEDVLRTTVEALLSPFSLELGDNDDTLGLGAKR